MAEYMDREAFKKRVEERYCKPCKAEGKDHNGCWCRACWVDDMLDEVECFQPSDVAPVGWVSVKDKLPEPEQDVLVIAHGWSGRLLYIGSYQRMEAETSWLTGVTSKASDWSLWGWSYLREPEVTHWMPLPEPPMSAKMDGGTDNG